MIWAMNTQNPVSHIGSVDMHTVQGTAFINFGISQPCNGSSSNTTAANTYLSPNHDFLLKWAFNTNKTAITFTMQGLSAGWVAIGIGSTATMVRRKTTWGGGGGGR